MHTHRRCRVSGPDDHSKICVDAVCVYSKTYCIFKNNLLNYNFKTEDGISLSVLIDGRIPCSVRILCNDKVIASEHQVHIRCSKLCLNRIV